MPRGSPSHVIFHPDAGLHPVRTLLEHRCGIGRLTDQEERLRLLHARVAARSLDPVRMVPLLAPVLGIAPSAGYEPVPAEGPKLYELIAAGVQEYLLACFRGGAGLLIAEDMQWFDASTLEVLGSLLDAAGGWLLVVIAALVEAINVPGFSSEAALIDEVQQRLARKFSHLPAHQASLYLVEGRARDRIHRSPGPTLEGSTGSRVR